VLPSSSEAPRALGLITRREGRWDESIYHFERALALDPHNVSLLEVTAWSYTGLRQFPAALKLYDRELDIKLNNPDVMAAKAGIYQAQGNLQEAARSLSGINGQTPDDSTFLTKITQLRLERDYGEAVRLLQTRLAQFHLTLSSLRALIRWRLPSRSALLAIRLVQSLPLDRRAIHLSGSAEINQRMPSFRHIYLKLMRRWGRRTWP
jgi:tetratricopeptide (TPR) repeat protein